MQLCNCDQREAVAEIPVPCLVVKDEHAQRTADTAAQQRPEEQPLFRNAPRTANGTPFVNAHGAECDHTHEKQIAC